MISISIVSHGQGNLARDVLADLAGLVADCRFEVILTRNIPEVFPFAVADFPFPLKIIENVSPKGFGENHNYAYQQATGKHFCVMNPDIRIAKNPFIPLLDVLERQKAAVVAPAVLSPGGQIEDSVRFFPTPYSLFRKLMGWGDGRYPFALGDNAFEADWVGGMFMLFNSDDYKQISGFDEGFFLYYEDIDICARLWKSGMRVMACPGSQVIHDARRTSHRNLKYMRWHVASIVRYLGKHAFRGPKVREPG